MSNRHSIGQDDDGDELHSYRGRTRERAKELERTRTRIKSGKSLADGELQGTVMTAMGPHWLVAVGSVVYVCTVSGTVECPHTSTIVTVGDIVGLVPDPAGTQHGDPAATIVRVEERRTLLSRKAAGRAQREQVVVANVDQLCIVMAAALPTYNKRLIDRYLIAADKGDLRPIICINKIDLMPEDVMDDLHGDFSTYLALDIPVIFVSAAKNMGLDMLRAELGHCSTLLSGPSGVGKSSIINLLSDARQQVGAISDKYLKGRHTTTAATSIPLPYGGSVVDSPGLREFAIWELTADELPYYFEEFAPFAEECRFNPCSHTHEPGCRVKAAVEAGELDPERYESYLNILDTIMLERS